MNTCGMTMSDGGRNNTNGRENYWTCGNPAVAHVKDRLRAERVLYLCKRHASMLRRRAEKGAFDREIKDL